MNVKRRALLASAAAAAALPLRRGRAQGKPGIKIGVLNDQSGTYRDVTGPLSVACARQAVDELGDIGFPVEVVVGDHQNKPDIGASIARQWFDRDGVDMILDVPTSSVALAVANIAKEKNKAYVNSGGATPDLTGAQCNPQTVHWTYDTYMLARSTGGATVKNGGDTWFFITANYVFGQQLQRDTSRFVTQGGGKVLGAAIYPFPETTDFSSFLLQAQSSGAKVVGLANAGGDTVNCVKQAHEFGLTAGGVKLAALLGSLQVVDSLTLDVAQGLLITESFYWDLNDRTRAFTKRLEVRTGGVPCNAVQAGCYGGTIHYLKAVRAIGVDKARDGAAVIAQMKAMPTDDDAFGKGRIREDGRNLCPAYLFEVKKPSESKGRWDYYNLIATTSGEDAAPPLADEHCPMVKS